MWTCPVGEGAKRTLIAIIQSKSPCKYPVEKLENARHADNLPKKHWFNIIAQLKKDGIYYYCNIASPFIIEENTIKYIDYDLDLRVFPTGQYKVLDRMEYNYHKKIMNYSDDLDIVIRSALNELIKDYEKGSLMFSNENNNCYYDLYKSLKKKD